MARYKAARGFTMIEMVVVLGIIAVLVGVLTPIVSSYIDQARVARAQADLKAIGDAISNFEKDVGRYPMYTAGAPLTDAGANVVRLEGPGALVAESSGTSAWTSNTPTDLVDCVATSPACTKDTFDNQFVANGSAYPTSTNPAKQFKWKGPYLTVDADPWGNKYVVNIIHAKSTSTRACFVLSAGPDGIISTPFEMNLANSNFSPLGDDLIYRIK
jgi:prepilin-type N-terminal cleavage/methylation domain-containing protein